MILGLQLYGPIACRQVELKELFIGIKNIGISRVEPCISLDGKSTNPSFWSMEKCKEVFPLLKELKLDCISCHVTSEDIGSQEALTPMCKLVDDYGVKHIVMGIPVLDSENLKKAAELYKKIAEALKEHNAELLVHNGKPDIAAKIQGKTAYEYLVDCCDGKVGMQFDTGWAARGGENPENLIKRNSDRIKSLHFKDFDMTKDTDVDTCIGDGTLNLENFALGENIADGEEGLNSLYISNGIYLSSWENRKIYIPETNSQEEKKFEKIFEEYLNNKISKE